MSKKNESSSPPPDPQRMADSDYIKRDEKTGEISWPPSRMEDMLKEMKLI